MRALPRTTRPSLFGILVSRDMLVPGFSRPAPIAAYTCEVIDCIVAMIYTILMRRFRLEEG